MNAETQNAQKSSGMGKLIGLVVVLIVLFIAFKFLPVGVWLKTMLEWIDSLGTIAPIALAGVYVLACVFMLPGTILTLGAGALFGLLKGSIAVSIGSTLGAGAAFLVGRFIARDAIATKLNQFPKFAAIDDAVAREGGKIVFLTRLSPAFPFNFLNYAYGLTKVKFTSYMLASWIGMIPGTIMYVYLGNAAGSLAEAAAGGGERTMAQNIFLGIGLIVTIVVTTFVTKVAKKALDQSLDDQDNSDTVGAEELAS